MSNDKKPKNPLAFPMRPSAFHSPEHGNVLMAEGQLGMTLRDYFAAVVLPIFVEINELGKHENVVNGIDGMESVATACYQYADAMLAERQKP